LLGFDYPIYLYIAGSHWKYYGSVHDVDIFTAHWAQFSFWQPKKQFLSIFIRLPPATITFFRQKNLMIWQIFYQIPELLSKNKCIGHSIFFLMKFCKKIHNLGYESVVINQYATWKKHPVLLYYYEITVKKQVCKFCELRNETERNETQETHNFLKRNETERNKIYKIMKRYETKRNGTLKKL
jgi:hypothetical protein